MFELGEGTEATLLEVPTLDIVIDAWKYNDNSSAVCRAHAH